MIAKLQTKVARGEPQVATYDELESTVRGASDRLKDYIYRINRRERPIEARAGEVPQAASPKAGLQRTPNLERNIRAD